MSSFTELFQSGRIADIVAVVIVIEAIMLITVKYLTGHGINSGKVIALLVPGFCLVMALRSVMADEPWYWLALWLTLSLIAHLIDVWLRWPKP